MTPHEADGETLGDRMARWSSADSGVITNRPYRPELKTGGTLRAQTVGDALTTGEGGDGYIGPHRVSVGYE